MQAYTRRTRVRLFMSPLLCEKRLIKQTNERGNLHFPVKQRQDPFHSLDVF